MSREARTPAPPQQTHPTLLLALLADGRLPVGGHTQSSGVEPALHAGLPVEELPAYLAGRLQTVVRVDAATAVAARWAVRTAVDGTDDGIGAAASNLITVWQAWSARTPSPVLRETAAQLGRGYLRVLGALWPGAPAHRALASAAEQWADRTGTARCHPPRPVVMGALAACAGLDAVDVAMLVGYDDVQGAASAWLKLEPADPVLATVLVLDNAAAITELAHAVAGITAAEDIPAASAPLAEVWATSHAQSTERLFRG